MTQTIDVERAETPPRVDLMRTAPFGLRAASGDDPSDGLTLDGYAAVFNRETIIDSWEGRFKERISNGSMKKSFRENPPKIQFDHGHHPLIGSIPIASLSSISEDSDPALAPEGGAHVVGRLFDNWLVQPVRDAIAEEAINGMSFRFSVVQERWFDAAGKQIRDEQVLQEMLRRSWYEDVPDEELLVRDLKELKVPELGPVVWPAYRDTSVGVRSQVIDLGRLNEPGERKKLAQAVLLADAAERSETEDEPQVTEPADEHPSESHDTPRPTDVPSAGEHESVPARGMRPIDLWVRKARDTVLNIEQKG
jgi:phage head maturation protease